MHSREPKDSTSTTPLKSGTRIQAVAEQVSTDLGGEAVILHIASGRYYSLDAVGNSIWKQIEQPRTVAEIVDYLLDEYDVERTQCERDLEVLVRGLLEQGLVRVVDD